MYCRHLRKSVLYIQIFVVLTHKNMRTVVGFLCFQIICLCQAQFLLLFMLLSLYLLSKETEIDIYSEEAVTTHLQFVLQKHGLADEKFSPAVPFLLNPSFRKIFVHMTEKNQVE